MSDLIDRKEILTDARRLIDGGIWENEGYLYFVNAVEVAAILAAPTVDAEPVKHGEWVTSESPAHVATIRCSECSTMYQRRWKAYCNYCPNCGAKMDTQRVPVRKCATCQHHGWDMPQCRECDEKNNFMYYSAKMDGE